MFRYLMLTLWIFLTALGAKAENQPDLIYYGWDSPDISQLLDIIPKLADSPFDGLGVFAKDHRNVFQTTPYPQVEYQNDLLRLSVIKRGALGRSFLVINTTTNDQFDWANEAHWQATLANTKMIARMAKAGGFSGILFDMEPYGVNLWNTAPLAKKHPMAFAEMQILLERRGQSMMQAIETEFPNPQMFFLWGLSGEVDWANSLSKLVSAEQSLSRAPTGLWPAFYGGMIKAAGTGAHFIDGNERSYFFLSEPEFAESQKQLTSDFSTLLPADARAAYAQKINVGQAVYADFWMNTGETASQFGYFLADRNERLIALKSHVALAMAHAKSIAWYYNEKAGWWQNPPADISKAVAEGKQIAANGKVSALLGVPNTALAAWQKRRVISGKFISNAGALPKAIHFSPTAADHACAVDLSNASYYCIFPDGVSLTLKPVANGATFEPPQHEFIDLGGNLRGLDWTVVTP